MLKGVFREVSKAEVGAERGDGPKPIIPQRVGVLMYPYTTIMQVTSLSVTQHCISVNNSIPAHLNQVPQTSLSVLICAATERDVPCLDVHTLLLCKTERRHVVAVPCCLSLSTLHFLHALCHHCFGS